MLKRKKEDPCGVKDSNDRQVYKGRGRQEVAPLPPVSVGGPERKRKKGEVSLFLSFSLCQCLFLPLSGAFEEPSRVCRVGDPTSSTYYSRRPKGMAAVISPETEVCKHMLAEDSRIRYTTSHRKNREGVTF